MTFESFLARRYLKIKHQGKLVPLITVLATFGVALGVMVLVVVIAVMTGFQSELKARILGIEPHMVATRYNEWISDYSHVVKQIENVPGVKSAAPFMYAQGMLQAPGGVAGVVLRAIDPGNSSVQVHTEPSAGLSPLLAPGDRPGAATRIVLGTVLADKLKLKVGDGVVLMVAGTRQADPRRLPAMHRLKVVGLFETGMHQYDGNMGFMSMHQLQHLMGIGDLATGIDIRVKDVDTVEMLDQPIRDTLGMHYWVRNWKQLHHNLFSMLAMQKIVMFVILTLIIVVAAFNIASALIMMVKEKTKDIAILKAMGATHRSLEKVFLGKGIAIGLFGIALGLGTGLLVCLLLAQYHFIDLPGDVYFLTTLPVRISPMDILAIVLGTLAICICASLYPAKQAAKLNPVDGIRFG